MKWNQIRHHTCIWVDTKKALNEEEGIDQTKNNFFFPMVANSLFAVPEVRVQFGELERLFSVGTSVWVAKQEVS